MEKDYEMITVKDYVDSLKNEVRDYKYQTSPLMRVQDYAKEIANQSLEKQPATLMTVQEYAKTLEQYKYSNASDKEIESKVEEYLLSGNSKAERNASIVESLLA